MLSDFQHRLAHLFLSLPAARGFALAGGAALVVRGVVDRSTHDLDFFAPFAEQVLAALESLKNALTEKGLPFRVVTASPSFGRLVVTSSDGEEVLVDLGQDFRLLEPESLAFGPVLTLTDLAADKLLALFGRAEARDFVDVFHLAQRLQMERILGWARRKDPGLDEYVLAIMLGRLDRHDRREFQVDDVTFERMTEFFRALRATLIEQALRDPQ